MKGKHEQESEHLFLPDLCGMRPLFVVLLLAQSLAIVLTLASAEAGGSRLETFGIISLFTQLTALSIAAGLCTSRAWLNRLPETGAAAASYAVMLLVSLLAAELAWRLYIVPGGTALDHGSHAGYSLRVLCISAVVSALALRYFYVQHHWRLRTVSEARARIQALQARIRPHFFFNCMNTIASLTRSDPVLAERAVEDLADLFRASLGNDKALVPAADELELARRYLAIESLRLGDRLSVVWRIESLPADALIPALTLQPLLENAIYHGVEPAPAGGTIRIDATRTGDRLMLRIENPFTGGPSERPAGNRIAQQNVGERLAALFDGAASLTIRQEGAHYTVIIELPYIHSHADIDRRR
ncbi:MAG: sensor histidine kinase [Gammaproteobacteria bacterium]|nr:sensor histidine kinase [Gammaproteobacteria bacterium]